MKAITNPPLQYHGSKWAIAPWIISKMPPHRCYVEPFCGGASVLMRKTPSIHEVINDMDNAVITFFEVLRTRTDELIRAIELTPYAREELRRAYQSTNDSLEMARRLFVRCWQSFGSGTGPSQMGWRYQVGDTLNSRANAVKQFNTLDRLYVVASRLKHVQIECGDAAACIKRFDAPSTLFYVDPPYVHFTRSESGRRRGYQHEMTITDHQALAVLLNSVRGMVILSGYPSRQYAEWFAGWECITRRSRTIGTDRTECLWLNPAVINANMHDLPMFREGAL